ncbi:MAG: protein phosphatase 2C domain-containing protein [Aquificota bacterium]|nr:protein phosphatase 2C domain-containing protein [Aquificota bacterium]
MRYAVREFYRDRETYADRVFFSEDTFAVADGMGVGRGASVAAEKAVRLVSEERPFRSIDEIYAFFNRANRKIMDEIAKLGDRHVTGTTLSLLSFNGNSYLIGHVGDSRIYLWRRGWIEMLTVDQVKVRGGRKYVSVLGIDWTPDVVLREGTCERGDVFLLISDGAVGKIGDEDLCGLIDTDVERSADRILNLYRSLSPEEDLSLVMVLVD